MRCLPGGLLHLFQIRNVVVHCRGGLGNQLFQASAGHLLAKELKTSFFIELFRTTAHNALNPVDISKLEVLKKYTGRQTYIRKLYSRFILKLNWIFPSFDLSSVGGFSIGTFDRAFRTFRTIHLDGYFADFTYEGKSKLFEGDIQPTEPSLWFTEMVDTITKEPVVALHVRRGDFLLKPDHYGILDAIYYKRAIAKIPADLRKAQIWVFSDSPSLARETLSQIPDFQFVYISPPPTSNALESLILMSLAEGQIIANSTFSIWAAYISKRSKFVCYPTRDRNGNLMVAGIPSNWIHVDGSWS